MPPLILHHSADNLRLLDLTNCKITDDAINGIVTHANKLQTLILSGCTQLTDRAVEHISRLGAHLDVLLLARVSSITDRSIIKLSRSCPNLRCIDLSCEFISPPFNYLTHSRVNIASNKVCRNLTDMSVFELAGLSNLRRLSLGRVHKLTDIAIFALAEHATGLERLHLPHCEQISLEGIQLLLDKLGNLQHLNATGISALRRKGIHRFSEVPPSVSPRAPLVDASR